MEARTLCFFIDICDRSRVEPLFLRSLTSAGVYRALSEVKRLVWSTIFSKETIFMDNNHRGISASNTMGNGRQRMDRRRSRMVKLHKEQRRRVQLLSRQQLLMGHYRPILLVLVTVKVTLRRLPLIQIKRTGFFCLTTLYSLKTWSRADVISIYLHLS